MHRFIQAIGAGVRRARSLSREEACAAMTLMLEERAEPVQVGAFLLALRMKGETPEELAGFSDALARFVEPAATPEGLLVVDAHGDGHGDRPSLLVAAACVAAARGTPVCLSVSRGSPFARHGLDGALAALGLAGQLDAKRAAADLARTGVAACDLGAHCPPLQRLLALRPLLGLRTAAQTVAKLMSPFAPARARRLIGVFHAPYLATTAAALGAGGAPGGLVLQALGGLPEARPEKVMRVADAGGAARTVDLRSFAAARPDLGAADRALDGALALHAALDGAPPYAERAAACAALLLHAATGADPVAAAYTALDVLRHGGARAIAHRLA